MPKTEMTNEQYQSAEGISFTALKHFAITPAHYKAYKEGRIRTKSKPIFTAAHMAILEPKKFETDVFVSKGRQRKKDKEENEEAEKLGKLVLTESEYEKVCQMRDGVHRHHLAKTLSECGENELSFFVEHPELKIKMKCRPDILWEKQRIFADLKGFNQLTVRNIQNQFHRMKYHWQQVIYQEVLRIETGEEWRAVHIFIEDSEPYGCRVVSLNEAAIEKAIQEVRPKLLEYKNCLEKNEWNSYPTDIASISLPNYAWYEDQEEEE